QDVIHLPHVGINLTVDDLQLVQRVHGSSAVRHRHSPDLPQSLRVEKSQRRRAVAHHQTILQTREPPAFPWIAESPLQSERLEVVHETDVGAPGELHQLPTPVRKSFREVLWGDASLAQHSPGSEIYLAQARASVQAGALVQIAVAKNQALRESAGVVRIARDHLEVVPDRTVAHARIAAR